MPLAFFEGYDHDVVWELVEKDPMRVEGRQTIKKLPSSSHQNQQLMIEFEPNPQKVYALSARVKPNAKNIKIKSILAWAKVFLD